MIARTDHGSAVVTGASTGIGIELVKHCAEEGFDLLIAADEPAIHEAADRLREFDVFVNAVEMDLSTTEGVDRPYEAAKKRPIDIVMANAGRGLGGEFPDQDFTEARHVLDTNITGTIYCSRGLDAICA